MKILAGRQWKLIYFDGFAGSGSRKSKSKNEHTPTLWSEFGISEEEENVYQGAAERVIRLMKPHVFDFYYFNEKGKNNLEKLKAKLDLIPESKGKKPEYRAEDCNQEIFKLANALKNNPKKYAALIFIDPFGMQVDWSSIEELKETRSDVWILLPTGVIVNRLLDRKGKLKSIKKLESFFGLTELEIRQKFYKKEETSGLFEDDIEVAKKIIDPINLIAEIYIENMSKIWKYVTKSPLRLNNTRGLPIFHFVFASNSPSALNIANYIIQKS